MLQQTTVKAVLPFYVRWISRYPTVESLAEADEGDVLQHWAGLGYYSRCRRLHQGAKQIVASGWPQNSGEWLKIPGVGAYTAAAISSISTGEAVAVVDGNVERVFARMNDSRTTGSKLTRMAWSWAREVLDTSRPADWNQAIMELGATVCTPTSPLCGSCPVQNFCIASLHGTTSEVPVPKCKPINVELNHSIWVPYCQGEFGIVQSGAGEWWAGLWGFPRSERESGPHDSLKVGEFESLGTIRHVVTRHKISVEVNLVTLTKRIPGYTWVSQEGLVRYAFPKPQTQALKLAISRLGGPHRDDSLLDSTTQEIINKSEC